MSICGVTGEALSALRLRQALIFNSKLDSGLLKPLRARPEQPREHVRRQYSEANST